MLRDADCQRYRQWKREQAQLVGPKRKIKIKKERKETKDCIEEEKKEKPKTILKIRYRKCAQKDTPKGKQGLSFKLKPVTSVDLLFKRIQPSLEVRHQLLAHRHAECFAETLPQIDAMVLRETTLSKTRTKIAKAAPKRKRSRRRKKDKVETTISEEVKKKSTEEEKPTDEQEETANEEETDKEEANEEEKVEGVEETVEEKVEEAEDTVEEKENVEEADDATAIDEKDDKKEVKRKKKDKFWCKKLKRKIDSESDDSECESICSFDSDICLKGLALTAEDKKKIQENRRHVQSSSAV